MTLIFNKLAVTIYILCSTITRIHIDRHIDQDFYKPTYLGPSAVEEEEQDKDGEKVESAIP